MNRLTKTAQYAAVVATLATLAFDAAAVTLRIECEVRPGRSRISIDAKGLTSGVAYSTQAISGGNMKQSNPVVAVGGEVQTDFDSNMADVRAGANQIPSTFISGGTVHGNVVDSQGSVLIAGTAACRVRNN